MKPAPFEYRVPAHLDAALDIMAQHGYDAKLLAGGQSLIPVMNFRLAQPTLLVDLNPLTELASLQKTDDGGLRIGAMVRQATLEKSDLVRDYAPLIFETMPFVAHSQIRNRGTIGGSLAHADPAGELPVLAVALEASFRLQRTNGDRQITAMEFYQGLFTTALEPEEILTEIAIPPLPPGTGCAFMEQSRRRGDYAQAGCAALITLDHDGVCRQARLVFLNAGEIPMAAEQAASLLLGQIPSPELLEAAARLAADSEIEPLGDLHASEAYKKQLAFVLGKRTLATAVARAQKKIAGQPT